MALVHDAAALEAAGASLLLVEACPGEVSRVIVDRATVPVIGCGAGPACHGQVVVLQDLLGLSDWQPAFARPEAQLGDAIKAAAAAWAGRVRSGGAEDAYRMGEGEADRLRAMLSTGTGTHAKA